MRAATHPTTLLAFLTLLILPNFLPAAPEKRYGLEADLKTYPQGSAKEALASVLKAVADKRFDYLTAHLADPSFVDDRVKRVWGGNFDAQVQDTRARLDPSTVKLLGKFLKDGEWTTDKTTAIVKLKDMPDKVVRFQEKEGRWFLEHNSARK